MLLLHAGTDTVKFRIDYRPMSSSLKVVPILLLPKDASLSSRARAINQISAGLRLAQAITADAMIRAVNGRKTFCLEADLSGELKVRQIDSGKSESELSHLSGSDMSALADKVVKNQLAQDSELGICFCPSWQEDISTTKDATVIGGTVFARLPGSIKEAPKLLINTDTASAGFGAPASTQGFLSGSSIALLERAMLELLGLTESSDSLALTSKSPGPIHRFLISTDPIAGYRTGKGSFGEDTIPKLGGFDAAALAYNAWLLPDATRELIGDASHTPSLKVDGDQILLDGANGIRVVGAESLESPTWFMEIRGTNPPKSLSLSLKEVLSHIGTSNALVRLRIVDDHGLQTYLELSSKAQ